jgi:hypothetical protein
MLLIPCAVVLLASAPSASASAPTAGPLREAIVHAGAVHAAPVHSGPFASSAVQEGEDLVVAYRAACEAGDAEALAALWQAQPGRVLVTIDADLEASLSVWEADPDAPDEAAIDALLQRARFGAEVASSALGEPIFLDYATSFAGWNAEQKRQFRAGQAAYGESRRAGATGDLEAALAKARECLECAEPLGDWWGTAMGLLAQAQALSGLERHEEALLSASRARLIYHQLGLTSSEIGALQLQSLAALACERPLRARSSANAMLTLFGEDGPAAGRAAAFALRAQAERDLGLETEAAASAAEAQRLAGG